MNTSEKIARRKEEIAELRRVEKAERERQRRKTAKEHEKEVINKLKELGYNPMKEKSHEYMMYYIEKYSDKIQCFLENGTIKKSAKASDAESEVK